MNEPKYLYYWTKELDEKKRIVNLYGRHKLVDFKSPFLAGDLKPYR